MGCRNSKSSLEAMVKRQGTHIESLCQTNEELRRIIELLVSDHKKLRIAAASNSELQGKIAALERKVEDVQEQLAKTQQAEDTLSREALEEACPSVAQEEPPMHKSRSCHSILEDPLVKGILERKRLMFRRKCRDSSDLQLLASPTMTSTCLSNKQPNP